MPAPEDKKFEINETIKNDLINNAEKQRQLRDALIAEMTQQRAEKSEIDSRVKRELYDVKAAQHWEAVDGWLKEHGGIKGAHGYIEYSTAMMDLCGGLMLLNKALAYDNVGERGMKFVWNHTLGGEIAADGTTEVTKVGQVLEGLAHLPGQGWDWVKDKTARGVGLRKSPELVYSVHIDEQGKLTTDVKKNGEPLPQDQQILFDTGLVAWLKVRGCEFDPATQIIKDEDNNIMTPEKFIELNVDDENGLTAFFEGRMDVELRQSPRP